MDPLEKVEERLLALRWQAGDPTAFAQLAERYGSRLLLYLRKMLQSQEDANDALQDVWLDACRSVARLRDCGAVRSWLYRIAHDRAVRRLRVQRLPVESIGDTDPVASESVDDFSPEDVQIVQKAMETLSQEHREALLLRFVEQMTYRQIAEVARCSVGTVRSRLHYARRAMRRAINEVKP